MQANGQINFNDSTPQKPLDKSLSNYNPPKKITNSQSGPNQSGNNNMDFNQTLMNSPKAMGHQEAIKDNVRENDKNKQKFDQLVERSKVILYKCSSVFPFTLFPDEVTIHLNQVSIMQRQFFFAGRRHSVVIEDIEDVFVDTSLFFATLKIVDRGYVENIIQVPYLWVDDAKKARRIIQGLMIASKGDVDITKLDSENLLEDIEGLGKIKEI